MLEANQHNLDKIHSLLTRDKSNHGQIARQRIIELVTSTTPVHLAERDAYYCFGMSKMTVKDESVRGQLQYNVLKPPEFYEFIGRVATRKY